MADRSDDRDDREADPLGPPDDPRIEPHPPPARVPPLNLALFYGPPFFGVKLGNFVSYVVGIQQKW